MGRSLLLLALVGCADADTTYMYTVAGRIQCGDSGGVPAQVYGQVRCVRVIPMVLPDTLPERTK